LNGFVQSRSSFTFQWHDGIMSALLHVRLNAASIRAVLAAALAVCLIPIGTAQADRFWPHYRSWGWGDYAPFRPHYRSWGWGDPKPFRQKHRRAHRKHEPERKPESQEVAKGALQIIISVADQRISVYDDGTLIARSSVSTGVKRHPTPLGVFSVIGKERWHRSNIYSAAPMPYMQRVTWSGIALHAGILPGHPASHGCIRLTNDFAIRLWHLTKRGTRVIIARNDIRPVEIANPHLFAAKTKAALGSPETQSASVVGTTVAAAHAPLTTNGVETQRATNLQIPDSSPAKAAPQKATPISVFVSRKLSRLFVRRGSTPLVDVPVKIENPNEPLGTHVFTAMGFQNEGPSIRWTVVSMPEEFSRTSAGATTEHKAPVERIVETAPPVPSSDNANAALDRIEIPQEVVERVSELLAPGSSLTISDYGISSETRRDTDFIVITR
jgi:lipoprotein-anchoring transpeptidase ErfK/SrfK